MRAVSRADRHGVYLEFVSEPGFHLMLKSLEQLPSGIRLLNVRRREVAGQDETLATVYVPDEKRSNFLRKIESYKTEQTASGKPKNAKLVDSVSDIRSAVLESFWRTTDLDRIPGDVPEWIELWVRSDDDTALSSVDALLRRTGVPARDALLDFPERTVRLIKASRVQIEAIIEQSDWVAELRPAVSVASEVLRLDNRDQVDLVRQMLERCEFSDLSNTGVCLLDTGVNHGHPLLKPIMNDADLHAVREEWGSEDDDGHGTWMAGTAAYGNFLEAIVSKRPLGVEYVLESAKILPPDHKNRKELWGAVTSQGISRAEIQAPARRRVICMAVTSTEDRNRGLPSSWSAAVDELASGYFDDPRRLIVVSAGNSDSTSWGDYPESNKTDEVHDPAQAWNALTVGAHTMLTQIDAPELRGYQAVAPAGGLSPHSTCSFNWSSIKWPIKPEVLLEGGNVARGPDGFITECDDLQLISTSRDPQVAQFVAFSMTSAAAAHAAHMAARLQVLYPDAWPETIRAAMVHSAEWTDTMERQFPASSKTEYALRARVCGYGVPDLDRAAYCMRNFLTLVAQAEMQPFDLADGKAVTKDMHFYSLPWPTDVLASLGAVPVTMRVTLSYFIEPGPGEVGWQDRYRYASHGFRFEVNGPGETEPEFKQRINRQAREDGQPPGSAGPSDHWMIGRARNVGSVHSDIWTGTAADLAASNLVAVYPTTGWWRERRNQNRVTRSSRYALMVSIHVPAEGVDIYTPVAVQIGIPVEIPAR